MVKRSYEQYCPVALTLDVVGDRWTLLIVRELLNGPLRYTDLQAALPGIPPNLLADRLRELEANGLVERQTLAPPAARSVFALTEDGRDLDRVVRDLARWGLRRLPPPEAGEEVRPIMAVRSALLPFARPSRATATDRAWVVLAGDEPFTLRLQSGRIRASAGAAERPDVVVRVQPSALLRYRTGARRRRPALTYLAGSAEAIREFEAVFDLAPDGANVTRSTAVAAQPAR